MKNLALSFLILSGCSFAPSLSSHTKSGGGELGRYRGYAQINQTLAERIGASSYSLNIQKYLSSDSENANGLASLFGEFLSTPQRSGYINVTPNGINLLLYHIAFWGLANDFAKIACESTANYTFHPTSIQKAMPLCSQAAVSDDVQKNLWLELMSFDAPQSEFIAWQGFLASEDLKVATGQQRLSMAVYTVFMNPYFLLNN